MTNLLHKLSLGVSCAAMTAAVSLVSQAALAQPADGGVESVTVTGTNIRGVAPVGSHVATVSQQDIQALAPTSVTGVLASLPQLSTSGTATQGENSYTFYSPNIHNLAASASNSTLVVVDGMRIPGGGSQWAQSDPNIIPVVALQRVEVLADGASSVYGSDAVAGVVNFITRKSFDGLQIGGQVGFGQNYQTDNVDVLWGTHWEDGNVYIAGSWSFGTNIPVADRPFASMGDYTSVGGNNQNQTACPVASIHALTPTAGAGGTYWFAGATGNGYANTQAARPCNNSVYGDLLPQTQRVNAMTRVSQDFLHNRLHITETLAYNDLHTFQTQGGGTVNTISATAYGPGYTPPTGNPNGWTAGQVNPFYQAPTGAPGTTSETVSWIDTLGPQQQQLTTEDVIYNRLNATFDISDNWHFSADWVLGQNNYNNSINNGFCSSCAYLALNGTALANGNAVATDVAGRNVVALNTPLTAANALDVWSPVGSNKTSAATIRSLYSNNQTQSIYNSTNQMRGSIDGALFDLPAGTVHMALGGEIYVQHILKDATVSNNTGPSSSGSGLQRYHYKRVVDSGFLEVQVPLISPEMHIPLVYKMSADVSGRIDSFSDVGQTSNPKYALDWEVTDDFKLRANYSTSFVAPPLLSIGDPSLGYMYQGGAAVSGSQLDNIPRAAFPTVAQIPTVACSTPNTSIANCQFFTLNSVSGANGNQGIERQMGGGLVNVKPETGIAWSVGMDWNPSWLEGFRSSLTLFNNAFKGAVNAAHIQQTVNFPSLYKFFTVCPSGCTQAQVNTFTNVANGATTGQLPAGPIYYMWAHDETNFLYLRVQGIDLDASYDYDAGNLGTFHIGDYLTLFTQFKEGYDGKTYFSIMNTSGFNGTFSSVQYNTRLNLGWTLENWAADFFVNYVPGYRNWNSQSIIPIQTDATGAPHGGGDKVSSLTTLDLNLAYTFDDGIMSGDQLYAHINNLFDTDPPFINTTANGAGASAGAAFGFNAFNANPIGRTVSVGIRAKF